MSGLYEFQKEDAERFARERGLKWYERGEELLLNLCPYCRGGRGRDRGTFAINIHTGAFNCKRTSCGAKGNMITLARDFGFSLGQAVDEYYSPRKRYRDLTAYPRPEVRTPAVEYMETRGISREVTERFSITTQVSDEHVLVFPFFDEDGKMQFVKYRKTDFVKGKDKNKEWCEASCKPILFGMDQCNPGNKTLILTEGQIDSLSVTECGIENAVSVPTGANGFTWVPYCWEFLGRFDTMIVFGDHEHGKITLLDEMAKRFRGTVKHIRPQDYQGHKDANELLLTCGKQAVIDAIAHAVPISNPRIRPMAEVRRRNLSELERISTGIESLDELLGGFYFGQLIVLTGKRGDGKSTLGSQFGAFALSQGQKVFYYSGEMEDWQVQDWLERQLAGPEHINAKHGENGNTEYLVRSDASDAIQQWYADRCWIYDNTSAAAADEAQEQEDLIETLDTAIRQYGVRFLIVDNLMTAMDDDMSLDLYRQQTRFARKLSQMAKAHDVIILLIAHPRKAGGDFKNDDVAGSANITNLADVVLNYSRPTQQGAAERLLQVTKNRLTGETNFEGIELMFGKASKRIGETGVNWRMAWEADTDEPEGAEDDGWTDADIEDIPF